jgi:hypothetical protein
MLAILSESPAVLLNAIHDNNKITKWHIADPPQRTLPLMVAMIGRRDIYEFLMLLHILVAARVT